MSHASELHLRQGQGPLLRVVERPEAGDDDIQLEVVLQGETRVIVQISGAERNVVAQMIELPVLACASEPEYDDRQAAEWLIDQACELALRIDQMRTVMNEIRSAFIWDVRDTVDTGVRRARAEQHPAYVAARAKIAQLREQLRELD